MREIYLNHLIELENNEKMLVEKFESLILAQRHMEESGLNSEKFKISLHQIEKSIFDVKQNKEVMLSKIEELPEKDPTQDNKLEISTENLPLEYWDDGDIGPEGVIQEIPAKSGGFKKKANPVLKKTNTEMYKDLQKRKNTSLSKDLKKKNTLASSAVLKMSKNSFKELKEPNHARKTSFRNLFDDIKGGNYREQTVSRGGSEKSGSQQGFVRMPSKNYSRQDSQKGILGLSSRDYKESSVARQRVLGNYVLQGTEKVVASSFKESHTANDTLIKKNRHQSLKQVQAKSSGDEKLNIRKRKPRRKSQISQAPDLTLQGVKKKKKKKLDHVITVQTSKSKISKELEMHILDRLSNIHKSPEIILPENQSFKFAGLRAVEKNMN